MFHNARFVALVQCTVHSADGSVYYRELTQEMAETVNDSASPVYIDD